MQLANDFDRIAPYTTGSNQASELTHFAKDSRAMKTKIAAATKASRVQ